MKVYVGQTRSRRLLARLDALGFGEIVQPGEYPPRRRSSWALDNGAFAAFQAGTTFNATRFELAVLRATFSPRRRPDFIVLPDLVAGGLDSLRLSREWVPRVQDVAPLYLVVQDGMTEDDVAGALDGIDGLFVGGSLEWKLATAAQWVQFARERGLPCHVGRCGTEERAAWAGSIGASSIDSSLPLFSEKNLERFVRGLGGQREMFAEGGAA